jgi:2-C-methyl-D-erythritol 4-phosphate cytidylyltransferase/2-C-methyl-D-erythritol 2,4-cyclodiphosphate synthase
MSTSLSKPIPAPSLPLDGRAFALITAAGLSTRFGGQKKELEQLEGRTVLEHAIEPFIETCSGIVVTCPPGLRAEFEAFFARSAMSPSIVRLERGFAIVEGGSTRQDSVRLGLRALKELGCNRDIVLIHDGARPWISSNLVRSIIEQTRMHGACLPLAPLAETPKIVEGQLVRTHPSRSHVMTAQTPQAFSFPEILAAHELAAGEGYVATDDAMIWDYYVGPVFWIEGERRNRKITYREDLSASPDKPQAQVAAALAARSGIGYDIHPLIADRPLLLAGVQIESDRGEAGYSDGDVLWHALIDALLGAAALGDIGMHFPPGKPEWKNADSTELARTVAAMLHEHEWHIVNIDCTVIIEKPRLGPYREQICSAIARTLNIPQGSVSFKAKTKEGFDAVGRGEAIEAYAIVLITK